MTFTPSSLAVLGRYWTAQGGTNLGVVGDAAHQARQSYHNGQDAIERYGRTSANDYSIRTARDRAGLTNAASAIDLGKLDGSLGALRMFSAWLVGQAQKNAPGTSDLREVIYSPDGAQVLRWDRQRGYTSAARAGEADDSHLTHTHISWYRDAQSRDHTTAFRPYFEESDVPTLSSYIPGQVATIKPTANVRTDARLTAAIVRVVATAETWVVTGWVKGDVDPDGGSDQWLTRWSGGRWEYTAKSNASAGPTAPPPVVVPPPPDTTPYSQAQLDAATAAGRTAGVAAGTAAGKTAERERIAQAEAARVRAL